MKKIGILGGGQLGRMTIPAALALDCSLYFLDQHDAPTSLLKNFQVGNYQSEEQVEQFAKQLDYLSYEREDVSTTALFRLARQGTRIRPSPEILTLTQNKLKQKDFFIEHRFPTGKILARSQSDWQKKPIYPSVKKLVLGGYDGQGVWIMKSSKDNQQIQERKKSKAKRQEQSTSKLSFFEEYLENPREIGILVARNQNGELAIYDPVEMFFDSDQNIMNALVAPAEIDTPLLKQTKELAADLAEHLNLCGLIAIELFLTKEKRLLINEIAARPHNSGHHTIDFTQCSQFEQWLRAIMNLPLGETKLSNPCLSMNLLGPTKVTATTHLKIEKLLEIRGLKLQLYGKKILPNRKVGHINVGGKDYSELHQKRKQIAKLDLWKK